MKAFYRQRIWEPSFARNETVDIDILITFMYGVRKIMQPFRLPVRIKEWEQFSQFRWTSAKVIPMERNEAGYVLTMSQGLNRSWKCTTNITLSAAHSTYRSSY